MEEEEIHSNIRGILGWAVGKEILDITQHDKDDFSESGISFVFLSLSNGGFLKFRISDNLGFDYNDGL